MTLITRIGLNTTLYICGDFMQSDINGKTGFRKMFNLFNDSESEEKGIHCFEFSEEDIMRSEILKYIIKKLRNNEKQNRG
jgi:phosphate starvation-inducible protein PhoH